MCAVNNMIRGNAISWEATAKKLPIGVGFAKAD
jgi:hypothetical protein